jgi:hypothetical protein
MDFIDWCHQVLRTMEEERFNPHLSDHRLREILLGTNNEEKARLGLFQALTALSEAELAQKGKYNWKITPLGRTVISDPTDFWTAICEQQIDAEEEKLLNLINTLSPQQGTSPEYVWLEDIGRDPILAAFNIEPPPMKSNNHQADLSKYIYDLPKLLADRAFLKVRGGMGYQSDIKPTYQGLVWQTRRGFTIESRFIDGLLKEWETTNVDFKRELSLNSKGQKGEFAKDVLGLVTTKSSGRRYMIVGFDDNTRKYYAPPDPTVTASNGAGFGKFNPSCSNYPL